MIERAVSIYGSAYKDTWIHYNRRLPVIEEAELYLHVICSIP
jgi:hypothetical protein